jgi:predicted acyltransferase
MVQVLGQDSLKTGVTTERYLSLDVLRGLTIALMIVVNNPGSWSSVFAPLRHAPWHGFTITDLVFPSFLFVVGNAMSFSFKKTEQKGFSDFIKKISKRTAIIFSIGLFLNCYPFFKWSPEGEVIWQEISNLRIMGVLQRIALCFFAASLIIYFFKIRGAIIFSAIALLGYWAIMYSFGDPEDRYSLNGNAALKFDLLLLAPAHLYKGYGIPFEPEGFLSTIPAIVNVILGFIAGVIIQKFGNSKKTVYYLIAGGLTLALLGMAWDIAFPINKSIWTSSFTIYTVGLNLMILSFLILVINILKITKWTYFFEVFGKNPLFIYILAHIVIVTLMRIRIDGGGLNGWVYKNLFLNISEGAFASFLYAISYMLIMWAVGFILDKKKIYIKV